jgi:hypothetical protein
MDVFYVLGFIDQDILTILVEVKIEFHFGDVLEQEIVVY